MSQQKLFPVRCGNVSCPDVGGQATMTVGFGQVAISHARFLCAQATHISTLDASKLFYDLASSSMKKCQPQPLCGPSAGSQVLRMCGGKQAGALMAWQSQPFSGQGEMAAALAAGSLGIQGQAQGTLPVSAVSWVTPSGYPASASASMNFMATSLDGRCHQWTWSGQKVLSG